VFDSNGPAGQFEVYLLSADGGQPKRLTNHPETDAIASFSRDGHWIYFMSNRTGRGEVWKLPVGGGEPIQVTANGGYVALESSDGQTLFYTKGQAGALWKMPTTGGSETKVLESVYARNFAPSPGGIYFMEPTPPAISCRFLHFATGNVRTIGSMTRGPSNVVGVSPDGRWFAYVQVDQAGSDIVLVENFR
jgi:Tol biopolymer transport system component